MTMSDRRILLERCRRYADLSEACDMMRQVAYIVNRDSSISDEVREDADTFHAGLLKEMYGCADALFGTEHSESRPVPCERTFGYGKYGTPMKLDEEGAIILNRTECDGERKTIRYVLSNDELLSVIQWASDVLECRMENGEVP